MDHWGHFPKKNRSTPGNYRAPIRENYISRQLTVCEGIRESIKKNSLAQANHQQEYLIITEAGSLSRFEREKRRQFIIVHRNSPERPL